MMHTITNSTCAAKSEKIAVSHVLVMCSHLMCLNIVHHFTDTTDVDSTIANCIK